MKRKFHPTVGWFDAINFTGKVEWLFISNSSLLKSVKKSVFYDNLVPLLSNAERVLTFCTETFVATVRKKVYRRWRSA